MKACEKRPISLKTLEETTDKVEKELRNTMEREISSRVIGEVLMKYLKELDHVAYVRFASVYREFTDIDNFMQELEALKNAKSLAEDAKTPKSKSLQQEGGE